MLQPLQVLQLYSDHGETLPGALESRLSRRSEATFLICDERAWTWRQFADATLNLASGLAKRGVGAGDRVAIVDRNSEAHVLLLFALAKLRATMVPVNPEFGEQELGYVLGHADVAGVFAGRDLLSVVQKAMRVAEGKPWLATTDTADGDDYPALIDIIDEGVGDAPKFPVAGPDDTIIIIYTSGTTGFPKGVMHSHRNFLLAGEAFVQRVHLTPDDRAMVVLPFYHMNALFYSLAGAVAAGASVVVVPKFSASGFWDTAAETGATQVNIIEAIGTILVSRPRSEYRKDHLIRTVYGVRENAAEVFRDEFGIHNLMGGYGMTEIPGVTCNPFGTARRAGSMGPVGAHPDPERPWAECRIVDTDAGNVSDVADGEIGELWVKTPIVMQGYFRDEDQTRGAFEGDWFKTGDLVRRDADGWYYFVSRKKDIIRRRGENIAAAELDRVVGEHPDIFEAAAIAVPSELGEDEILIAAVPNDGRSPSAEAVADWCRERLAPIKVPRFVVFVDELPHTPTHKIAKAVLRKDATLKDRAIDLQPVRVKAAAKETT